MKEQLEQIKESALVAIVGAETEQALEEVRVRFLGKKGELTAILRGMGAVAPEDRPKIGAIVNTIRAEIEESLSARFADLKAQSMERKLREERIDVTLPAPEKKVEPAPVVVAATDDTELIAVLTAAIAAMESAPAARFRVVSFRRK